MCRSAAIRKLKMKKLNALSAIGTALVLTSGLFLMNCKGTDGAVGPAGAIGPAGAAGATGTTGSANVIYSDWISVTFTGSITSYVGTINAPKLTQDILDKGLVQTYFKNTTGLVNSLNFYQPNGTTPYSLWAYNTVGKINMNGANYNPSSPTYLYRYILVPGGVGARKAAIDYTDYEAVKEYYNLPD